MRHDDLRNCLMIVDERKPASATSQFSVDSELHLWVACPPSDAQSSRA
jgi:hypothetical protein